MKKQYLIANRLLGAISILIGVLALVVILPIQYMRGQEAISGCQEFTQSIIDKTKELEKNGNIDKEYSDSVTSILIDYPNLLQHFMDSGSMQVILSAAVLILMGYIFVSRARRAPTQEGESTPHPEEGKQGS